jgi:hypothetical protein
MESKFGVCLPDILLLDWEEVKKTTKLEEPWIQL